MKWLTGLWRRIRNWLTPPYRAVEVADLPETLAPHTLYLVGEGEPWQAAMMCPCGCRATVQLSMVPRDRPSWSAVVMGGKVSLCPSVWRVRGCGSHFFLTANRIHWC